jgi:hypothetical protein
MHVSPVDEQFVSDAWNTIDPKPTGYDIAQLWCDQMIEGDVTEAQFDQCVKDMVPSVMYYLPTSAKSGEVK